MSTPSVSNRQEVTGDGPVFRSVACGVDGTRAGFEAARQAALLARGGAFLRLLAVTWETGTRASAMVELGRRRATAALDRAAAVAHDLGVPADRVLLDGPHAAEKLLDAARADDLLVVGSSGRSHAGGLVLGHAADEVLRRAPDSVLVARRPPIPEFPGSILVAADAPALADAAAMAGRLARRHGGDVTVMATPGADPAAHHAVGEAGATITAMTGAEPVVVDGHGRVHTAAAHLATDLDAALVVTAGEHAVRVAESARCSVLVLRRSGR
jgi:nucleotide-binding universal stress UspA family protein